jgi:hypothetical protein
LIPKTKRYRSKKFSAEILPTEAQYIKVKAYYFGNFRNGIREPEEKLIFLLMKITAK